MTDLRKAAEMALEALNRSDYLGWQFNIPIIKALRQALAQNDLEEAIAKGTKAWADVPNASEWVEQLRGNVDKVDTSEERVHKTDKSIHEWVGLTDDEIKEIVGPWGDTPIKGYTRKLFDQIETKLREKNHG